MARFEDGTSAPSADVPTASIGALPPCDPRWIIRLLRFGFALGIVAEIGYIADNYFYLSPPLARLALPYALLSLGATVLAMALTLRPSFSRDWKAVTFGLCIIMISAWTVCAILVGQQITLFAAIIVVLMATSTLTPWGPRWQAALAAGCIAACGFNTALVRPDNVYLGYLWLDVLTASALALASSSTWSRWGKALAETHRRLGREMRERERTNAEREDAQRRLGESEAKLRKIFRACPDIICINSMIDGHCVEVNREFLSTGYTREDALSGPLDLWAKGEQCTRFVQELSAHGVVRNMEAEFRTKDGAVRPCLISGAIIEIDGEPFAVSFSSDISHLKETERELIAAREAALAASRAKSEFLSSMSHEIRTPMNAILGMSDLLAETPLSSEQSRYVNVMRSNGSALLDLINDILDLARVESGLMNLEQTNFDLGELTERIIDALGVRAREKRLDLAVHIGPDVALALIGDPIRLRQVLISLVSNAIKFTEEGELVLSIENEGSEPGCLRFSVRDTGIGIPSDKLEAIFQSFTQVDSSATRKYGGSGLGLAIARRLVELMGGRIRVESAVGRGSTFSFSARFGIQPAASSRPRMPAAHLEDVPVLVVDDNATNRLIVRELLVRRGAKVVEAGGGEEALREYRRAAAAGQPYRLVLVDCRMPDIDGFEVTERLRRLPDGAKTVILILTSDDLNPKLARLRELGLDAYIVKPLKRSELLQAIAAAMGKARVVDENPATQAANKILPPSGPKLRILLVEDSPDNRMLVQAYLKNSPYELHMAENGEIAVRKFTSDHYDLVLMDVQMPVMDGYTAVGKIRQWERHHEFEPTPIVALTASAHEDGARQSLQAGCTAFLSKPVRKSTLLEAIRQTVASNRLENSRRAERVIVQADPDLCDLIPAFLERKRGDLTVMMTALERRDYAALGTFGHCIKGEGGGFGFNAMSEIGAALEQAARAHDAETAQRQVEALCRYLDRVEVVFREPSAADQA